VVDTFGRPLGSLRLSVTDRCNLRCSYCMPEPEYVWLPRENILSFEEMATLVGAFTDLGVDKVRLTGGEPLLRRNLARLVRLLRQNRCITEVALTTNGIPWLNRRKNSMKRGLIGLRSVSIPSARSDFAN
jgi:cyclic pyranopterin phosphate synthase